MKRQQDEPPAATPDEGAPRPAAARLILLFTGVCVVLIPLGYPLVGPAALAFSLLPVLLTAWFYGMRMGVLVALGIGGLVNPLLLLLFVEPLPLDALVARTAPMLAVLLLAAAGIGRMRDLDRQLRHELAQHQKTIDALRTREQQYRSVIENVRDVVFQADLERRWTFLNTAWTEITGFSLFDSLGIPAGHFIHPEDRMRDEQQFEALLRGEVATCRHEVRFITKSGGMRWIEVHALPLRNAEGEITGISGTLTDITDTVRFQAEHQARQQVEELLQLKTDFLNNMSHELRTPLTGILGFAEILSEEVGVAHREFAERIRQSGKRLFETINAVLDLAQLEGRRVHLRAEPVDVAAQVRAIVRDLQAEAGAKRLFLRLNAPEKLEAHTDRTSLERVVQQLVRNAIKFTEEGGVTVEVWSDAEHFHVRVDDTGIGIGADFMPYLFEEFRQESRGLTRSHEGSGLGLSITKRLVELMDGTISVASLQGEGSTFTVSFPRVPPQPEETPGGEPPEARRAAQQRQNRPSTRK